MFSILDIELTRLREIILGLEAENERLRHDLAMAHGRLGAIKFQAALRDLAETPVELQTIDLNDHLERVRRRKKELAEPQATHMTVREYQRAIVDMIGCTGVSTAEGGE